MKRRLNKAPMPLYLLFLLLLTSLLIWVLATVELERLYIATVVISAYFVLPRAAGYLSDRLASRLTYTGGRGARWISRGEAQRSAWNAVVLPEGAKRDLMTLQRILEDPEGYKKRWGLAPPLGAILHGPPGTGKTMIARTLASSAGYAFIAPSPAELSSMWVGESEKAIRALFDQARTDAPCVVFLDELDALAAQRSGSGSDRGGAARSFNNATNQLLQEIDGFRGRAQIFTVGATNRLDILDAAITSRLSMHVHVDLPGTAALVDLFRLYTWPYRERLDVSVETLAYGANGMSGRDVQEACKLAAMNAESKGLERVGIREFTEAFSRRGFTLVRASARSHRGRSSTAN